MWYQFLEWDGFTDKLYEIASDAEYQIMQTELSVDPERGDIIRGLKGARKIRMALGGKGKRGGARVIYYFNLHEKIWLLDIYGKGSKSDLSWEDRKRIAAIVGFIKGLP